MIIGLTVVSFATSAPELIVSIQSALDGLSGLALGNVIGSNIANIALVLGATALIAPLAIDKDFFKFNWQWMMAFSVLLYVLLLSGNNLVRWEGFVLLTLLILFIFLLLRRARKKPDAIEIEEELQEAVWWKIIMFLILGGLALWQGSELLVKGAVDIAASLGIPESIIAVSMVAVGTSVPELAASIIAALKKEKAISLGNLIGSNIFNIGSVLGITAIIQPIQIEEKGMGLLNNDIYWMLGIAFLLLPMAFIPKKYEISRFKGIAFLGAYLLFLYLAFSTL
ncbi:K+-dependent Na+/Ca+ exchanger related protein [Nonlabens dokdonensis DSW-6]|uniref:K+-dependent Na+/Ca+ exchanger related protein n=2 Tax=Nonlabens dokdonensis TaxID=328515 RepID=L7WCU8_NONDD|nr:K+-dependent Na+/Ca+ exchanger related protein [Nonlabens dokdonensis DSW-6]